MSGVIERSILSAGYAPLDILVCSGAVRHTAGGTAANVPAILAYFGWRAAVAADYGADLAGRRARRDLAGAGVSVAQVRLRGGLDTPRVVHEVDESRHWYRFSCPSCGSRFPTSRPLTLARADEIVRNLHQPDVFFFDRLNVATLRLAEHYADNGTLIVLEPSRPARADLTERALHAAHIVKHADTRDPGLGGLAPGTAHQVHVETLGANGVRFRIGDGRWHLLRAYKTDVADAGGAGDWTTAGLIHALPRTQRRFRVSEIGEALEQAQAFAALSCTVPGARGLTQAAEAATTLSKVRAIRDRAEPVVTRLEVDQRDPAPRRAAGRCSVCLMPRQSAKALVNRAGETEDLAAAQPRTRIKPPSSDR